MADSFSRSKHLQPRHKWRDVLRRRIEWSDVVLIAAAFFGTLALVSLEVG